MKKVFKKSLLLLTVVMLVSGCGDNKQKMLDAESSALDYIDVVEKQCMLSEVDSELQKIESGKYLVNDLKSLGVESRSEEPKTNGVVIIDNKCAVDEAWLQFGDYKVYYDGRSPKALGKKEDYPTGKSKNKNVSYVNISSSDDLDDKKDQSVDEETSNNENSNDNQTYAYDNQENSSQTVQQTATEQPSVQEPQNNTPSVSVSKQNALRSAKDYLNTMAFSYNSLIEQLEYEGYPNEDAVYAVNNCGADWYQQAAKSARDYLNTMPFSRSGLIEQLEYEGFTHEQAEYGVNSVGL